MARFVVRIWLSDRPGALGAVASRIGSVGGDVVAIEVLERDGGAAVDEMVVDLPDAALVDLMVREVHQVDSVKVEQVRAVSADDRVTTELGAALALVEADHPGDVLSSLCRLTAEMLQAAWAAVVDPDTGEVVAETGSVPPRPWLHALAVGLRSSATWSVEGMVAAPLAGTGLALASGGSELVPRRREREAVAALANIAGVQWARAGRMASSADHPSRGGRRPTPVAL